MKTNVKVLLIEDDEEDYKIIRDLLSEINTVHYKLEWESDAEKAMEKIRRQESDVYLIDHRLGKTTGLEIIAKLKEENLQKPMILLTGSPDRELDLSAMESGAWDFISKGRVSSELLERSIRYSMKRAEDAEKLKQVLVSEAANQAKSQFLANMSHEIRTPLTAILGYAHLAKDREISEGERFEFIEVIEKSGEHLLELINDILDLSKIEAGQIQVFSGPCNWKERIEEVLKNLEPRAMVKAVKLNFEYDSNLSPFFKTDCQRFRQILFNVIGNAVKFTEKGEVKITAQGSFDSVLKISVQDTGIGISPAEQEKLFQIFSQAKSTHSRKYGGTGLGLNISKRLAKALGGDLELKESSVGTGSTFVLRLPLIASEPVVHDQDKVHYLPDYNGEGLRILLVDDSPENRGLITRFLTSAKFKVDTASDGREGVDKALHGNYDAVLMDIEMPEMDGYEATSTLRSRNCDKPVIALTAHALSHLAEGALQAGFTGYITKPVRKDDLIRSVLEFIKVAKKVRTVSPG